MGGDEGHVTFSLLWAEGFSLHTQVARRTEQVCVWRGRDGGAASVGEQQGQVTGTTGVGRLSMGMWMGKGEESMGLQWGWRGR